MTLKRLSSELISDWFILAGKYLFAKSKNLQNTNEVSFILNMDKSVVQYLTLFLTQEYRFGLK